MTLRPSGQKQGGPQQISVRSGEGDVVDEDVVQRSLYHRDPPVLSRSAAANANSAIAARGCLAGLKSNWRSVISLCIRRPSLLAISSGFC